MARPRRPRPSVPVKLPLFDYQGWASRLVKSIREGQTIGEAIGSAEAYAKDVRDIECAHEAARIVGRGAEQIRKNCAVPSAVIVRCQEDAARDFGAGREFSDRKLARFLAGMYQEVRAAQVAEAVREAGDQAKKADTLQDEDNASRWRRVEANLEAMRQSITGGGFVPVPFPRG